MNHLSDFRRALTPALWAALWAFLGPFTLLALSVLQDVAEWASSSGKAPLPGLSAIGYALVSAACAAISGLFAFAFRFMQAKGLVAGEPPKYAPMPGGERGQVAVWLVLGAVVAVVVLIVLGVDVSPNN